MNNKKPWANNPYKKNEVWIAAPFTFRCKKTGLSAPVVGVVDVADGKGTFAFANRGTKVVLFKIMDYLVKERGAPKKLALCCKTLTSTELTSVMSCHHILICMSWDLAHAKGFSESKIIRDVYQDDEIQIPLANSFNTLFEIDLTADKEAK